MGGAVEEGVVSGILSLVPYKFFRMCIGSHPYFVDIFYKFLFVGIFMCG